MESFAAIGIILMLIGTRVVTGAIRRATLWAKKGRPKTYSEKIAQTSRISIEEALAFTIGGFLLAFWEKYHGNNLLFFVFFLLGAVGLILTEELIRFSYKLDKVAHRKIANEPTECESFAECIKGQFLLVPHVYHQTLSPLRMLIRWRWIAWLDKKMEKKERENEKNG